MVSHASSSSSSTSTSTSKLESSADGLNTSFQSSGRGRGLTSLLDLLKVGTSTLQSAGSSSTDLHSSLSNEWVVNFVSILWFAILIYVLTRLCQVTWYHIMGICHTCQMTSKSWCLPLNTHFTLICMYKLFGVAFVYALFFCEGKIM